MVRQPAAARLRHYLPVVVKIRQEDELLAKHFGPAFDEYRHRVRTLIPGIW
jgi:protein-S-isoprenylcysteine O-methyltransferase Ste14